LTAAIIDGKAIAAGILDDVAARSALLRGVDVHPVVSFIMLGDSAPALLYANRLERVARPVGIEVRRFSLPDIVSVSELERTVSTLSQDSAIDGILVQLPLPDHLSEADIGNLIDPRKDVDGITVQNAGRLYLGIPGQVPSTALAMVELLDSCGIDGTGKDAVVVGRSKIVGHPVAELLIQRNATVTVTHSQTRNLARNTLHAEILMVAAGSPHLVTGDMVRAGAIVVDAGINAQRDGIVGDVDFEAARRVASAITPVPGGVGPVTNAVLLRSVVESAERRHE